MDFSHWHVVDNVCLFSPLLAVTVFIKCVSSRGVTIHFFHKRYVSRYLICITIRFIGNCNYSLKSLSLLRVCQVYSHGLYNVCVQSTLGYGYGLWSLNATFNNISVIALWSVYFGSHGLYNVYVQSALAVMVFILCVSSHIGSHGFYIVCVKSTLAVVVFINGLQSLTCCW